MMLIIFQAYLITCCLFLAGKDADSYQLKDKKDNDLSAGRIKRWHRDGFILYVLFILPLVVWDTVDNWKIVIAATLIRLAFFDLAFNHWASLPTTYLGGTAWADKQLVKIFGINGAVKKSLTAAAMLIAGNLLNHYL
jgi:hypothetical protein